MGFLKSDPFPVNIALPRKKQTECLSVLRSAAVIECQRSAKHSCSMHCVDKNCSDDFGDSFESGVQVIAVYLLQNLSSAPELSGLLHKHFPGVDFRFHFARLRLDIVFFSSLL